MASTTKALLKGSLGQGLREEEEEEKKKTDAVAELSKEDDTEEPSLSSCLQNENIPAILNLLQSENKLICQFYNLGYYNEDVGEVILFNEDLLNAAMNLIDRLDTESPNEKPNKKRLWYAIFEGFIARQKFLKASDIYDSTEVTQSFLAKKNELTDYLIKFLYDHQHSQNDIALLFDAITSHTTEGLPCTPLGKVLWKSRGGKACSLDSGCLGRINGAYQHITGTPILDHENTCRLL